MLSNDLVHCAVQTRHRGRHRRRLGLPQLGRALDVGEQQRHRPGRKEFAHVNVAFLNRVHAIQDPALRRVKHPPKRCFEEPLTPKHHQLRRYVVSYADHGDSR